MQVVGAIIWWYTDGWILLARRIMVRLDGLRDYFSIGLLLTTLFAPFRQISAGGVSGGLDAQFRAFIDKSISRLIGAFVRLAVLVAGVFSIIVGALLSILVLIFWAFVPLLPIIGLVLTLTGWVPWKII